jgi:hypothetical protein
VVKLVENRKWTVPEWQQPRVAPRELVASYARLLERVQGVAGLWAVVRHGVLHFYTLVPSDEPGAADGVYEAELEFWDAWGESPVEFHVRRSKKAIEEKTGGAEPVLVAAL